MKHDFSASFLRVIPPDTTFGKAWESLCFELLTGELQDSSLVRLNAPDRGVDILRRKAREAYQCKSDERGVFGSLSADASIESLTTACANRASLIWDLYSFCTNARYTGAAYTKILETARDLGLDPSAIEFKGPEYWDDLCTKHFSRVAHRFNYRITATEKQVLDALKSAGYFEKYIQEYGEKIKNANLTVVIQNNRTPLEIEIPFSPELSVENCLDAAEELLGISLKWTNFLDVGTSAGPSVSLTINKIAQGFSQKIADLPLKPGDKLELWIKVLWRDETKREGVSDYTVYQAHHMLSHLKAPEVARASVGYAERKRITLERVEDIIQTMIWHGAAKLMGN